MPFAHISEYRALPADGPGKDVQVAREPCVAVQRVAFAAHAESAAFNGSTRYIRVVCTDKAHFKVTTAGSAAVATDPYLPADCPEYFGVTPADKISFYDGTS